MSPSVKGDKVTRARWQQDLKASSLTSNTEAEGQLQTGPHRPSSAGGPGAGLAGSHPKLCQNASPDPGRQPHDPGSLPTYDGAMKLQRRPSQGARCRPLCAGIPAQPGRLAPLLAGLRRDGFTVTSRRNDLDKEETLSVTSLSPRLGLVWNPIEEHAFYLLQQGLPTPVGGGLSASPRGQNNNLDPQHTRLIEGA